MALPTQIDEWFKADGFRRETGAERFVGGSRPGRSKVNNVQVIPATSLPPPELHF